tara:strand:- start:187 stop:957 length:771 start_codon:yes stop_codon:yes gene_type:complete
MHNRSTQLGPGTEAIQIQLPLFEGPLDLLLRLLQRQDLDITEISLLQVADQYLEAVHAREITNAKELAEFVSIGARLIQMKSRALLPEKNEPNEEDYFEEDPAHEGLDLVAMLREYQRFQSVATELGERQKAGLRAFPKGGPTEKVVPPAGLTDITMSALTEIMASVLARPKKARKESIVQRRTVTLAAQVDLLKAQLVEQPQLSFRATLEQCLTRLEIVMTFLALLELLKLGVCEVVQEQHFGDITIAALTIEST